MYSVSYPDLLHSSVIALQRKIKYELTYIVYFQSRLLAPHITIHYDLKFSRPTLYIYTNNNTAVSRSDSFITVFVGRLFTAELAKAVISQ